MTQRAKMTTTTEGIEVQMEYNTRAIEAIKGFVDKKDRTYNAETRTWLFKPHVKLMVQQILENYYELVSQSEEVRVWPEDKKDNTKSRP